MPGRSYNPSTGYRFAYQGQEKDGETGFLNFELRQYDPRIGRWFNPDPMHQYYSPYLAMGNDPMRNIDPTGGEDGNPPTNPSPDNDIKMNTTGSIVTVVAQWWNGFQGGGGGSGNGYGPRQGEYGWNLSNEKGWDGGARYSGLTFSEQVQHGQQLYQDAMNKQSDVNRKIIETKLATRPMTQEEIDQYNNRGEGGLNVIDAENPIALGAALVGSAIALHELIQGTNDRGTKGTDGTHTTYQHPSQSPLNGSPMHEPNNEGWPPNGNWKGGLFWGAVGFTSYVVLDNYNINIDQQSISPEPISSPVDATYVAPPIYPH